MLATRLIGRRVVLVRAARIVPVIVLHDIRLARNHAHLTSLLHLGYLA